MDVTVNITGIVMCCNESVCGLELGCGYSIEKCYLDDFQFKEEVENGKNQLVIEYMGSRLQDENGIYFMCLKKADSFEIDSPQITQGAIITDSDYGYEETFAEYQFKENQYLHKIFSLLRLFKNGNIGLFQTFFEYKFKTFGFINNTHKNTSKNSTRNSFDNRKYLLRYEEIDLCNEFLHDYSGKCYDLLKPIIDEFMWGLEQIDEPTGFEQYITALEMALLPVNQPGKKQMLSNRVAALLGNSDMEIKDIHDKMLGFYRLRSESLHEGDGSSISKQELIDMENYVRLVIVAIMQKCKSLLNIDETKTWEDIKDFILNELIVNIQQAKLNGVLD